MTLTKSKMALAIVAASCAQFVQADAAQKQNESTMLLDQITVSAARTEKKVADTAGSVTVIDRNHMDKNMVQDIGSLIKYEPGVVAKTNGGRFGLSGFNIRGMEGDRVKIMVDGQAMPHNFESGPWLNSGSNFIDTEMLKSVEIIKGPSSTLNGTDALGGAVAFVTKDPSDVLKKEGDDNYASIKSGYGSVDKGFTSTLTLANRTDRLESLFMYTRRDGKETQTHGSGDDVLGSPRGEADSQDTAGNNYLGKLQYQLTDAQRLGLTLEHYNDKVDGVTESQLYSPNSYGYIYDDSRYKDQKERSRVALSHEWQANTAVFDSLKTRLGFQKAETINETWLHQINRTTGSPPTPLPDRDRYRDSRYKEENWQYSMVFEKSLEWGNSLHSFLYGVDLSKRALTSSRYEYELENTAGSTPVTAMKKDFPDTDEYSYAAFISNEISLFNDQLRITPTARYDYRQIKTSPDRAFIDNGNTGAVNQKNTFDKLTGQLGAVYRFTDNVSGFAQFAQGFRAPKADEMYQTMTSPYYEVLANPDLKAETSKNYEIGIRTTGQAGHMEAVAFYSDYDNFIEVETKTDPATRFMTMQNKNMAEARVKGIELKGVMDLSALYPAADGFTLIGSAAFADGKYRSPTKGTQPLNSIAPLQGVLTLAYDAPTHLWGSAVTLTMVKGKSYGNIDQTESKSGKQFETPGFGLVDMTAYYKPVKDVTLRAGLFNITDKKYWQWNDVRGKEENNSALNRYTQPGRNFAVSVKWEI